MINIKYELNITKIQPNISPCRFPPQSNTIHSQFMTGVKLDSQLSRILVNNIVQIQNKRAKRLAKSIT